MKIDFGRGLKNPDGTDLYEVVKNSSGEVVQGDPMTLQKVTVVALQANQIPGDQPSAEEKFARGKLADKILTALFDAPDADGVRPVVVEISIDEAKRIKDLIGKVWGPTIVFRAWEMLEHSKETVQ